MYSYLFVSYIYQGNLFIWIILCCKLMWCIMMLPPLSGLLSNSLSLSRCGVVILMFLCYLGIWFITISTFILYHNQCGRWSCIVLCGQLINVYTNFEWGSCESAKDENLIHGHLDYVGKFQQITKLNYKYFHLIIFKV